MRAFIKTYLKIILALALVIGLADFALERAVALHDKTTVLECPGSASEGTPMATSLLKNRPSDRKVHLITLIIPSV